MKRPVFPVVVLCLYHLLFCKDNVNVKLSGELSVGIAYEYQGAKSKDHDFTVYDNETVQIGKAELETNIKAGSGVKGRFELEADHNLTGVRIKECWIQFTFKKPIRLRVGNQRKVFGLEELHGSKTRPTIHRSFINRYIQSFGVLSYDPLLQVRGTIGLQENALDWYAVTGLDPDLRVFGNIALWFSWKYGTVGFSDLYAWHWDKKYFAHANTNLSAVSCEYLIKQWYSSLEIFTGLDPNASDLTQQMGDFRKVYFIAVKLLVKKNFPFKETFIAGIEPILSGSWLMNDTETPLQGFGEVLTGLTIHFGTKLKLRWMTDGSIMYTHDYAGVAWGRYNYKIASQVHLVW
jgi:hypothetical protein